MLQYRIAPPKLFPFFLSACPYKEVTGSMETFHRLGLIDWHGLIVHSEPLAWLKVVPYVSLYRTVFGKRPNTETQ